jgi:hypothetical protein
MPAPLIVACGALANELRAVLQASDFAEAVEVRYLPANLHNRPDAIVPELRELLRECEALVADPDRPVLIGYADCGTGGHLDALIAEYPHLQRLPGAHCYEMFAGAATFAELHEAELGTFYLTDFLAKHFDALVWQGLGLDRQPQLRDMYFGNYTRVVLLAQVDSDAVRAAGEAAAARLGLQFHYVHTGVNRLAEAISVTLSSGKAA